MKILMINDIFSPRGGAEVIFYNTYKVLQKMGHDVYIFCMDKKPLFEYDNSNIFLTKYNGGVLNYIKNPINYYYNLKIKKDLNDLIEKIQPNIVHIHVYTGLSASIFDCLKNIPTCMTIHSADLCCLNATLLDNHHNICNISNDKKFEYCIKERCVNNSLEASIRRAFLFKLIHKKLKYIDYFITPSDALKDIMLNANIGISKDKICTINNYLSSDEFGKIQPNYENKGYFLYIGRLSKEKGVHYLLEAMKDLPKDVEIHIVGKGNEENKLKQYAKENNLNNVKFLGFKNREEIKEEYQNCIASILPCNCFETFGLTNTESFINGKPVIASNIGGIPEIVENNKTGLLFEPANIEELKDCILKYWNNSDLVIEHGKNAYEKATRLYTEERYYADLKQLYEDILNER